MDGLVEKLYVETYSTLYDYEALSTSGTQRASGTFIQFDSKWSKVCLTLIRIAWDAGIDRSLRIMSMLTPKMI